MAVNFKSLFWAACIGVVLQGNAQAAQNFLYVKKIELSGGTVALRATCAAADANGNIYFTSNFVDDGIYTFNPVASDPNQAVGRADMVVIDNGNTQTNNFTSSSYIGITVDKVTGDVWAAGPSKNLTTTPNNAIITRLSKSGSTWSATYLNRSDSIPLSGVQSVGENKLVFTNPKTGGLYFYEFNPTALSLTARGTAIGDSSIWAPTLAASSNGMKIYQARGSNVSAKSGEVDVFSYSYATGTNTYSATRTGQYIAGQTSQATAAAQPLQYQGIAINDSGTLLAVPVNLGKPGTDATAPSGNFVDIYDISGVSPVKLTSLNGPPSESAGNRSDNRVFGITFFKQADKEYFFMAYASISATTIAPYTGRISHGYVYEVTPKSDIDTWEMY